MKNGPFIQSNRGASRIRNLDLNRPWQNPIWRRILTPKQIWKSSGTSKSQTSINKSNEQWKTQTEGWTGATGRRFWWYYPIDSNNFGHNSEGWDWRDVFLVSHIFDQTTNRFQLAVAFLPLSPISQSHSCSNFSFFISLLSRFLPHIGVTVCGVFVNEEEKKKMVYASVSVVDSVCGVYEVLWSSVRGDYCEWNCVGVYRVYVLQWKKKIEKLSYGCIL